MATIKGRSKAGAVPPSLVDVFPLWDAIGAGERDAPGARRCCCTLRARSCRQLHRAGAAAPCQLRMRAMLSDCSPRQGPRARRQRCHGLARATCATPPQLRAAPLAAPPPPGAGLPTTGSVAVEKHEDSAGLCLPPAALPFLDAWKRPEELVQGSPSVPVVLLRSAAGSGSGGDAGGGGGATVSEKKGAPGCCCSCRSLTPCAAAMQRHCCSATAASAQLHLPHSVTTRRRRRQGGRGEQRQQQQRPAQPRA